MSAQELVSIVMPSYNSAATIALSVASVLDQTYPAWELIIINDASTDGSGQIARELAARDARIRVLDNDVNSGIAATRNRGVAEAHGTWIAFLDSDDLWMPNKLERQMAYAQESAFLFTGSAFVNTDNNVADHIMHVPARVDFHELIKQNVISNSSVLVRRELLLRHPVCEEAGITEDYATWLAILSEVPYALGVDEPLLIYRVQAHSESSNKVREFVKNWRTFRLLGIPAPEGAAGMVINVVRTLARYRQMTWLQGSALEQPEQE